MQGRATTKKKKKEEGNREVRSQTGEERAGIQYINNYLCQNTGITIQMQILTHSYLHSYIVDKQILHTMDTVTPDATVSLWTIKPIEFIFWKLL